MQSRTKASITRTLAQITTFSPTAIRSWAIKWLAVLGVSAGLALAAYMYGAHNTNANWTAKIAQQKTNVADQRADNAIDAGKRLGRYTKTDAQLEAAVSQAKQAVHDYYKANPPEARLVEKIKLVSVPGKEEYVYVPIGICPNDFFNADELLLWNMGNKGDFAYPSHPK